jgi:DNA-binding PadR family transcriptional regulator
VGEGADIWRGNLSGSGGARKVVMSFLDFIYINAKYICSRHTTPIANPGGLVMSERVTPLTFQILVSLADADRHGYGIIKEIEDRAGGTRAPSTGALYLALQRMESDGLIAEAPGRPDEDDDARRRYYRVTPHGLELARNESRRLASLVASARAKKLLAGEEA